MKLMIKTGSRYRAATKNEVLDTAAMYLTQEINGAALQSPSDTEQFLITFFAGREHEQFAVIFLDNRHRVINCKVLFSGTIDGASVYPREVVKAALEYNAAAVILSHNHPSGIAEPSQADERITHRLKSALELIDVRLLDHLIIGGAACTSLAARGLI